MRVPTDTGILVVAGIGLVFCMISVASMAQTRGRSQIGCPVSTALVFPAVFAICAVLSSPVVMVMAMMPYRGMEGDLWTIVFIWTALAAALTCLLTRAFLGPPPVIVLTEEERATRAAEAVRRPVPHRREMAAPQLAPFQREMIDTSLADVFIRVGQGGRWLWKHLQRLRKPRNS